MVAKMKLFNLVIFSIISFISSVDGDILLDFKAIDDVDDGTVYWSFQVVLGQRRLSLLSISMKPTGLSQTLRDDGAFLMVMDKAMT